MLISLCRCEKGCGQCIESVLYSATRALLFHAKLSGISRDAEAHVADFLFIRLRKSAEYKRLEVDKFRFALKQYVGDINSGKAEELLSWYIKDVVPLRDDPRVLVPHLSGVAVQLLIQPHLEPASLV